MPIISRCLYVFAALTVAAGCSTAVRSSRATGDSEAGKKEAEAGWISIVSTYFTHDCAKYKALLADTIKIVNPYLDTLIASAPLFDQEQLCDRMGLWTGGLLSIDDYRSRYDFAVYSRREYTDPSLRTSALDSLVLVRSLNSKFFFELLQQFPGGLTDDDYFIVGDISKDPDNIGALGSAFLPVIRKTKDGWKIYGMLP